MNVLTRSYHPSRTGANTNEAVLNPSRVASNVLIKSHNLVFHDPPRVDDDARLEPQPLYVREPEDEQKRKSARPRWWSDRNGATARTPREQAEHPDHEQDDFDAALSFAE